MSEKGRMWSKKDSAIRVFGVKLTEVDYAISVLEVDHELFKFGG